MSAQVFKHVVKRAKTDKKLKGVLINHVHEGVQRILGEVNPVAAAELLQKYSGAKLIVKFYSLLVQRARDYTGRKIRCRNDSPDADDGRPRYFNAQQLSVAINGMNELTKAHFVMGVQNVIMTETGEWKAAGARIMNMKQLLVTLADIYDVPPSEALQVCVHFDGAKELRGKNMMRVCIRIMNPILRGGPNRKVQSETDVWPISSFYIKKEDYATLHPAMEGLRSDIKETSADAFRLAGGHAVEWHLAADLKALWIALRLSTSTSASQKCLFCTANLSCNGRCEKGGKAEHRGLSPEELADHEDVIVRGLADDSVFGIPIERIHVCSFHAETRLVEKLLMLLVDDMWAFDGASHPLGIGGARADCEKPLSDVPAHNRKSEKRLRNTEDRISLPKAEGGLGREFRFRGVEGKPGKAARIGMSNTDARMILEMGEDLVRLAKPVGPLFTATQQQARIDCWNGLRDICAFLRCHDCSGNLWSFESRAIQAELFQIVMDKFGKAFDRAYGKGETTFYMHILWHHGAEQIRNWGPLGFWNCQAMEKSHFAHKKALVTATPGAGGKPSPDGEHPYTRCHRLCMQFRYRDVWAMIRGRALEVEQRAVLDALPDGGEGYYFGEFGGLEKKTNLRIARENAPTLPAPQEWAQKQFEKLRAESDAAAKALELPIDDGEFDLEDGPRADGADDDEDEERVRSSSTAYGYDHLVVGSEEDEEDRMV